MNPAEQERRGRGSRRETPTIYQSGSRDCGICCLAMLLQAHGVHAPVEMLRPHLPDEGRNGASALDLVTAATRFGFGLVGVRLGPQDIEALPLPCILHIRPLHFLVLDATHGDSFEVVDPYLGRRRRAADEIRRSFLGVAIVVEPDGQ